MTAEAAPLPEPRICPICRVPTPRALHLRKGIYRILRCRECGLAYADLEPSSSELESLYGRGYFVGDGEAGYLDIGLCERQDRINFRRRLRKIEAHIPSGRLLDLGCGTGLIFETAGPHWEVWGVDMSCYAIEQARARGYDRAFCGDPISLDLPAGGFDCALCWGFLEHLPDPSGLLGRVAALVRRNGVINVVCGDVESLFARLCGRRWHIYTLPEVLSFFSLSTLSRLLERAGFEVLSAHYETNFYSADYLIERLTRSLGRPIWRAARPMNLIELLNRIVIPVNFRDSLFVVARRL